MARRLGIVIPVVNNFSGVSEMMKTIREPSVHQIYITPNWIENHGVSKGWNRGIMTALHDGCTHIAVCNDDILIGRHSLMFMMDRIDREDNCILVSGRNVKGAAGNSPDPEKLHEFAGDNEGENPDYSFFMITRQYWTEIGPFDENFSPAYFEDNDSHRRINVAGYCAMNIGMAPFYHFSSVSREKPIANVTHEAFKKNLQYYIDKWGGSPGNEKFTSPFMR